MPHGIPRIRGLEGDGGGRQAQSIDRQLIDPRIGLEGADLLDRENGIEQGFEARALDGSGEHIGRPVRQDRHAHPGPLQPVKRAWDFRIGVEGQVKRHEAVAQGGLVEAQRVQRKIKRVAGDLPEIRVTLLGGAKPGVLQLLVAPQRSELVHLLGTQIAASARRGGKVEQGAIGVEHAGSHAGQGGRGHDGLPLGRTRSPGRIILPSAGLPPEGNAPRLAPRFAWRRTFDDLSLWGDTWCPKPASSMTYGLVGHPISARFHRAFRHESLTNSGEGGAFTERLKLPE